MKKILLGLVAAGMLIVLAYYFFVPIPQPQPHSTAMLLNISGDPDSLDPRKCSSHNAGLPVSLLFEGLLNHSLEFDEVRWGIADRVEISPDCTRYTFHLRPTKWSDGIPLTAHDFEYSWKETLDPRFPSTDSHLLYPIKNAEAAKKGVLPVAEVGVTAINDHTLVVEMEQPFAFFLKMLSSTPFFPVPRHIAEKDPQWANHFPIVGNGPFKLDAWQHDQKILMSKNPLYYDHEVVKCEAIHLSMVGNETTVLRLFENGELDMVGGDGLSLPLDAIEELQKEKNLSKAPYRATRHCAFNTEAYPFHNLHMRQAFSLAVNRSALADNVLYYKDEIALNMIPKILRTGGQQTAYFADGDITLARHHFQKALEELGTDAESLDITFKYDHTESNTRLAQALQAQWYDALGVRVKLVGLEVRVHTATMRAHQFQCGLTQWTLYYDDAANIVERFRSKSLLKNYLLWEDSAFTTLLDHYLAEVDGEKRDKILGEMEAIFMADMPFIPLFHYSRPYILSPQLHGLQVTPTGVFVYTEAEKVSST